MVDFTLADEQRGCASCRDFAAKEIRPKAGITTSTAPGPREIVGKAWEVGLMNAHIPAAYGGDGLGYLDGCLIEEEMSWGCSGVGPRGRQRLPGPR